MWCGGRQGVTRHLSQQQRLLVLLLLGKLVLQLPQSCIKVLAVGLQCSAAEHKPAQHSSTEHHNLTCHQDHVQWNRDSQ
jgi:hypothetical protein